AQLRFLAGIRLPSSLHPPSEAELLAGLEERRLDLLALREASASQDATVRAAVLAQFPKITLGFARMNDTSNVHTTGLAITMDFPIFDRNQGVVAAERATRQRLLDEYNNRLFEARSDIATALSDIASLNRQIAAADEALPLLDRLVSTAEKAVEEGNADVLGYYAARSNLLQKRIQVLKLKEQLVDSRTALEIASGRYLPGAAVRPHSKK
ncbi:MAG: TolC family protein, partial [Chthoniobacteraceae bacterium]